MRFLLDTNIWISAVLVDGNERRLIDAVRGRGGSLVVPAIVREELENALRMLLPSKLDHERRRLIWLALAAESEPFSRTATGDDAVLAEVGSIQPEFLVTGDRALLHRKRHGGTSIVRTRDALRILGYPD